MLETTSKEQVITIFRSEGLNVDFSIVMNVLRIMTYMTIVYLFYIIDFSISNMMNKFEICFISH